MAFRRLCSFNTQFVEQYHKRKLYFVKCLLSIYWDDHISHPLYQFGISHLFPYFEPSSKPCASVLRQSYQYVNEIHNKSAFKELVCISRSAVTLCNPMDCSPPGSVHEILPASILESVAISFSRGSSRPRKDWTHVSCIAGRCFTIWAAREAL